jgi:hypothetical protein
VARIKTKTLAAIIAVLIVWSAAIWALSEHRSRLRCAERSIDLGIVSIDGRMYVFRHLPKKPPSAPSFDGALNLSENP